jgi:hypothetical protein
MNEKLILGLFFLSVSAGCQSEDKKQTLSIILIVAITSPSQGQRMKPLSALFRGRRTVVGIPSITSSLMANISGNEAIELEALHDDELQLHYGDHPYRSVTQPRPG